MSAARKNRLHYYSEPTPIVKYVIDHSYGELEITDIVSQFTSHLPLEVVVSKGIYGMEERYSLSTSDKCIIHFLKKRDLVRIHDPQTNKEFSVPLSSAIRFSLIYNPNGDEARASIGYKFPLVSDVLAMTPLPKMGVAHLTDPDIEGLKSTELLVIKEVSIIIFQTFFHNQPFNFSLDVSTTMLCIILLKKLKSRDATSSEKLQADS